MKEAEAVQRVTEYFSRRRPDSVWRLHEFSQGWYVEEDLPGTESMGASRLVVEKDTGLLFSVPSGVPPTVIRKAWPNARVRAELIDV